MTENGAFRTDDMTLATLLAIRGYTYFLEKLTATKALWVFSYESSQEEEFDDCVGAYEEWTERVEPRQFVLKLSEVRNELYQFLPPRRRPGAPTPVDC